MDSIEGRISNIRYHQNNYLIALLDTGEAVKGPMGNPRMGITYRFHGKWQPNRKWGPTFAFEDFETLAPADANAARAYLVENAPGVGQVTADRIVEAFGAKSVEICRVNPMRVTNEVKGVSAKLATDIAQALTKIEGTEALRLELRQLFEGTHAPKRAISNVLAEWGEKAPTIIRENPYLLIEQIRGIGFPTADAVAKTAGFAKDGVPRIRAGIFHILKEAANFEGHTCLPPNHLTTKAADLLDLTRELIRDEAKQMVQDDLLVYDEGFYLPELAAAERYAAEKLAALMEAEVMPATPDMEGLMPDQTEALLKGFNSPVFILTGCPGVGKSYAIGKIIKSFPDAAIELAAPTGKAAKRMYELTGSVARTIHKLLEPLRDYETGKFQFTRNEDHPIHADLVIIDETSMVDVRLFASLLKAIKPGTRLILVGDTYQLPPVGPGNVLRDMINSGAIPCHELTVIKRQDPGLIISNCHAIKDGRDIEIDNSEGSDFFFVPRDHPADIVKEILSLVLERLPAKYHIDPLKDIQVITPLRKKTEMSCKPLNEMFQARLTTGNGRFRLGDKVINCKNNYELDILNGDIGFIQELDHYEKVYIVDFESPRRRIEIPMNDNDLDLAYVITAHKYQGSEAPIIIIPAHKSLGTFIPQRSWLYTAVSRAQKVCILVGNATEVRKIIGRSKQRKRFTGLKRRLVRIDGGTMEASAS